MKTIFCFLAISLGLQSLLAQSPSFEALNDDCVRIVIACLEICKTVSDDEAKVQCINECRQLYVNCTNAPSGPGTDPGSSTEAFLFNSFDQILMSQGFDRKFHFLSVSPNPNSGTCEVRMNAWPEEEEVRVHVLNSLGKTVGFEQVTLFPQSVSSIPFSITGPAGLYIIKVELGGTTLFRKMILK